METNNKRKSFIIHGLRKLSYKWPPRSVCLRKARVARGLYKCAKCGGVFKRDGVHLDHINPVIATETGFVDYNTYITRLFCEESGFQVVCVFCHSAKTELENSKRKKS